MIFLKIFLDILQVIFIYIFPKISNSTLTGRLFLNSLNLLVLKYEELYLKKLFLETLEIVNDTPLIDIEAFSTRYFKIFLFLISNFKCQDLS